MARPIWTGCWRSGWSPCRSGCTATDEHTIHFHLLERGTSDRIRYRKVNERTGDEVDAKDIVTGYQVDDDQYVIVEPKELDEIAPGRSQTIAHPAWPGRPGVRGSCGGLAAAYDGAAELERGLGILLPALTATLPRSRKAEIYDKGTRSGRGLCWKDATRTRSASWRRHAWCRAPPRLHLTGRFRSAHLLLCAALPCDQ